MGSKKVKNRKIFVLGTGRKGLPETEKAECGADLGEKNISSVLNMSSMKCLLNMQAEMVRKHLDMSLELWIEVYSGEIHWGVIKVAFKVM